MNSNCENLTVGFAADGQDELDFAFPLFLSGNDIPHDDQGQ